MQHKIQIIEQFLTKSNVRYYKLDSGKTFNFEVKVPEGSWVCRIILHERTGISIYSILPVSVHEKQLADLAIYLMKLNNERVVGNFELDTNYNEIKFKTFIDFESISFNERILERNILINNATMQKNISTLMNKSRKPKGAMLFF
jgi:hypothetical protein